MCRCGDISPSSSSGHQEPGSRPHASVSKPWICPLLSGFPAAALGPPLVTTQLLSLTHLSNPNSPPPCTLQRAPFLKQALSMLKLFKGFWLLVRCCPAPVCNPVTTCLTCHPSPGPQPPTWWRTQHDPTTACTCRTSGLCPGCSSCGESTPQPLQAYCLPTFLSSV